MMASTDTNPGPVIANMQRPSRCTLWRRIALIGAIFASCFCTYPHDVVALEIGKMKVNIDEDGNLRKPKSLNRRTAAEAVKMRQGLLSGDVNSITGCWTEIVDGFVKGFRRFCISSDGRVNYSQKSSSPNQNFSGCENLAVGRVSGFFDNGFQIRLPITTGRECRNLSESEVFLAIDVVCRLTADRGDVLNCADNQYSGYVGRVFYRSISSGNSSNLMAMFEPDLLGRIGSAGDRSLVEVLLTAGMKYFFEVQGTDSLAPNLRLLDANGRELATDGGSSGSSFARITFNVPENGIFILSVEGANNTTGSFKLGMNKAPLVDIGAAALMESDEVHGAISEAGELRLFHLKLEKAGVYLFDLLGRDGLDPYLSLFDGHGRELAFDDDSGLAPNDSSLAYTAPSDESYILSAAGVAGTTGPFELRVTRLDFAQTLDNSDASGDITAENKRQIYRLDLEAGKRYSVDIIGGNGLETFIRLINRDGRRLHRGGIRASYGFSDNSSNGRIQFSPDSTGIYFLLVEGRNETTGTYALRFTRMDGAGEPESLRLALPLITGQVSDRIDPSRGQRHFRLDLKGNTSYALRGFAIRGPFPDVDLFDSRGQSIDIHGISSETDYYVVFFVPRDGTYFLLISAGKTAASSFWLKVEESQGSAQTRTRFDDVQALLNGEASGSIGPQGGRRYYAFEAIGGGTYVFDAIRKGDTGPLDPVLSVLDPQGRVLATDDDSGFEGNARVRLTIPSSGTYVLSVEGYGGSNGTFTVRAARVSRFGVE